MWPSVRQPRTTGVGRAREKQTQEEAERLKRGFQRWATKKGVTVADRRLDWERLVSFYAFPREHWKHLRTTNVVESPFAAVRLRTAAAKRYKGVENATAVIWKTLLIAERRSRRLDAPELLADVANGVLYVSGERQRTEPKLAVARTGCGRWRSVIVAENAGNSSQGG